MAQDNVDVIQTAWEAFGRGDIDKATSVADPSAEFVAPDSMPWGGTYHGPRGLRGTARRRRRQLRQVRGQAGEGPRRRRRPRRRGRAAHRSHEGRPGRRERGGLALQDAQRPGGPRRRLHRHRRPARRTRLIRLSVVTVTFNSAAEVRRSLPALAEQLRDGDELIVVDNGSGDGTAALVGELVPDARLIEAGSNLGFAAGCNRGADAAEGELLVLLNPDAVPAPGWRDAIERPRERRPRLGRVDGARHGRGRARREHQRRGRALHRHRVGGRRGRAGRAGGGRRPARGRVRLRRLSRDQARHVARAGRLSRELLPLPGGRRPVASPQARGRPARDRARRGRRPRLRVRQGRGEVALPGAKPLGDAPAHLPGRAARAARARAAR